MNKVQQTAVKKTISIKSKMILTFVTLIILFSSCITFLIYHLASNQLMNQIDISSRLILKNISNQMEGYLAERAQVATSLTRIKTVKDFDIHGLKTLLPQILRETPGLSNAYVSTTDGRIVVFYIDNGKIVEWKPPAGYTPSQQDWYKLPAAAKKLVITPPYIDEVSGKTMVSLTAPYTDFAGNFKGVVGVDITLDTLVQKVKNISIDGNGKTLLLGKDNTILAFHDKSVVMKKITEQDIYPGLKAIFSTGLNEPTGHKRYVEKNNLYDIYFTSIPAANWVIAIIMPHAAIMSPVYKITKYFILLGFVGIILFGIATAIMAGRISKPIAALCAHAKKVANGDLTANIEIKSNDEIGLLANSINNMTSNLRNLIEQINSNAEIAKSKAELEKLLKEAELKALQHQINPHFMFNVLNSINRLISLNEYHRAQEVLNAFTKMLRYNMNDIENVVTLRKELEYVEKYLFLQNLRFGSRVIYNIRIDEELLDFQVPFFTLQPLVENAIEHGLEPKESGGEIQIFSKIDNEKVMIVINDNGLGMSAEKLNLIRNIDSLEIKDADGILGIGIRNVHNRLKLLYGNKYSFYISSQVNEGTTITLTFLR